MLVQGHWQLAEQLFQQLESEAYLVAARSASDAAPASTPLRSLNAYAVDWATSSQQANTSWEQPQQQSAQSASAAQPIQISTAIDTRRLSSSSFGYVPRHMAEQVLDSPTHAGGCTLPDEIPGQVNFSPPQSFSFFGINPAAAAASGQSTQSPAWTYDNAATSGLQLSQQGTAGSAGSAGSSPSSNSATSTAQASPFTAQSAPIRFTASAKPTGGPAKWGLDMRGTEHKSKQPQIASRGNKGPVNEVVCGAMMLAYERAGKWEQVSFHPLLACHTCVQPLLYLLCCMLKMCCSCSCCCCCCDFCTFLHRGLGAQRIGQQQACTACLADLHMLLGTECGHDRMWAWTGYNNMRMTPISCSPSVLSSMCKHAKQAVCCWFLA